MPALIVKPLTIVPKLGKEMLQHKLVDSCPIDGISELVEPLGVAIVVDANGYI